jgi:CHAT domain-containing protein/tetratricopeptide (TPR) repeat protein
MHSENQEIDKAFEINSIADLIVSTKIGIETISYANICFNKGRIHYFNQNYIEAEKWYSIAKSRIEVLVGKLHINYIATLVNLAVVYEVLNNFEKAELDYLEAKDLMEKLFGKDHPRYSIILNNLGVLYQNMNLFEKAEPIYIESKDLKRNAFGENSIDYAIALGNLANLYQEIGNFEKSEKLFIEAKPIFESDINFDHPDYLIYLQAFATLCHRMGKFESAEKCYHEQLSILYQKYDENNLQINEVLNNLGLFYYGIGNFTKSEKCLLEAQYILENKIGKKNQDYARVLGNLGSLYQYLGEFEKAKVHFLESLEILDSIGLEDSYIYIKNLMSLANLFENVGDFTKSEEIFIKIISLPRNKFSDEVYATCLNGLGFLYTAMGLYHKADPILLEAKNLRSKVHGKQSPEYSCSLNNLAQNYWYSYRLDSALPLIIEAYEIQKSILERASRHLSESELTNFSNSFSHSLERNLSFAFYLKDIVPTCYDMTLFLKGFLLSSSSRNNKIAIIDTLANQKYITLKSLYRRLSVEYSKKTSENKIIPDLEEKAYFLEKELAEKVSEFNMEFYNVPWAKVLSQLSIGEAAIEFVHYKFNNKKQTDSTIYGALILYHGCLKPVFIQLFDEKQLIQLLSINKGSNFISQLYASRGATPIKSESLQGLYNLIWKPLDSILQYSKTIYYSPSGLLHQINFDAIIVDENMNLSDRFKLVRLGSTRSLVVEDILERDTSNNSILFGGINYNLDTTLIKLDTHTHEIWVSNKEILSFTYADRELIERGNNWGYLPGTEKEIRGVSKIFQKSNFNSTTFTGNYATEESFKAIGRDIISPRVLHIATHGFFFPDSKSSFQSVDVNVREEPVFKISDHPMIRSGLILSGGNYAWKEGKPYKEGMEDGILTAYEISQMNLSNTELVVLSACETGLGDIQGNEGVYGLQRAFKIAGAKYLMMSLWQVPDEETKEFMITFYRNWLNEKRSIPDAFRITQKEMREKYNDPYLWAGFVLVE